MIDWVTCKLPLRSALEERRTGGHFILTDKDGTIEKDTARALPVTGSHDSRLHVYTNGSFLYWQGNPAKFFQGHNLFGSDDLHAIVCSTSERICHLLELEVSPTDRAGWWKGWVPLSRVDCTIMLEYATRADVRSVLRSAELYAASRHGSAVTRGNTVYLGLGSRRWSLKLYSKGDELESRSQSHHLPDRIAHRQELEQYADTALRVELQLRRLELVRRGLALIGAWTPQTVLEALQSKLEAITMGTQHRMPSEVLDELPGRLVGVYEAWRQGHDIRAIYSRATFYRYRKELLEYGINIENPSPPAVQDAVNIVPLNRVLEGRLAEVPEWAQGTSLYFDPPLPTKRVVNQ